MIKPDGDLSLFLASIGGIMVAALGLTGWLTRRQDALERRVTEAQSKLEAKLDALAQQTASRHDTALADIWQALEGHRIEARRQAAEADKRSSEFREDTLRQLGNIAATLARLEARLPATRATQELDR
jgi:uncharacterized membrane protein YccC